MADRNARIFLVCCAALLWAGGAPVHAQNEQKQGRAITLSPLQTAQLLITNNRLDEAARVLDQLHADRPGDSQVLFLMAMVATARGDYDRAITLFRRILVTEPDAERVRLELARAFFLNGDYDNADRQFRFARAGGIDDRVKANIDRYLALINRLRQWTVSFSLSLAPDTNQNAATASSQVTIYGLPFDLDPNARRQSGIGIAGDIGAEWSPLLFDNVKARIGADASRVDYGGGGFDDMTLSGYAGPQFLFGNWDLSTLLTGFERWYGNRPYIGGLGGMVSVNYGITSDLLIGASVGGQDVTNTFIPAQDGPLYTTQIQARYVLSPSSLFQLLFGFNRQQAHLSAFSYAGRWFGGTYQQDLPLGFSAGFQPSYYMTRYDAPLTAFGRTRADDALMLSFSLLNRRFDYHGFTPRFSYVFTRQQSNIALYSYTRSQFQIGVTSLF